MARPSFGGWRLSSSGSDENMPSTANFQLASTSAPPEKDFLDISTGEIEYVPLSERLKQRSKSKNEDLATAGSSTAEDELPVFSIPCRKDYLAVPTAGKENPKTIVDLTVRSTKKSPLKRKTGGNRPNLSPSPEVACFVSKPVKEFVSKKLPKSPKTRGKMVEQSAKNDKKEEAAKRKAMNSHLKTLKPEECMKYMICCVSQLIPGMFEGYEFMKEMQVDFQTSCLTEYFDVPCVRWKRKVLLTDGEKDGVTEIHDEPEMLVVIPVSEFVKMVHAYVANSLEEQTLTSWVKQLKLQNPQVNVHLVCHGLEKYNKNLKSKLAREAKRQGKNSRKQKAGLPDVSLDDTEEALVDLQIECGTTVLYVEKPEELVAMIKQLTKSIGEAPYKRMKRQDVIFINETPSVKVNAKTGEGTKKVWKQMIQQFHNVTPVMATAIADKYPSLLSLMSSYEACGCDVSKAESLLADIPVRRGVGTIQTSRRIGPELAYKIYRLVMSIDPDERLY